MFPVVSASPPPALEFSNLLHIAPVPTGVTVFLGTAIDGPLLLPTRVSTFAGFETVFASQWRDSALAYAVRDFFHNGGRDAVVVRLPTHAAHERHLHALRTLDALDSFNLLCMPTFDDTIAPGVVGALARYCEQRRAVLLLDPPSAWHSAEQAIEGAPHLGTDSANAALFFPRLRYPDPLRDGQFGNFAPCGAVAGVIARTDAQRGVWKAPAGLDATLASILALSVTVSDAETGRLHPRGINCLRSMPGAGCVVWGARTLQLGGQGSNPSHLLPVRRTALFIEQSLERGLSWLRGQRGDAALWARVRLAVGGFMHALFQQGAFQGRTPHEAYVVRCERALLTQQEFDAGLVRVLVGFAPLRAGEFVEIHITRQR